LSLYYNTIRDVISQILSYNIEIIIFTFRVLSLVSTTSASLYLSITKTWLAPSLSEGGRIPTPSRHLPSMARRDLKKVY